MQKKSSIDHNSAPLTWRSAFHKQARSDYAIFKHLNRTERPFCQQLHYLQMATEKLAKGFLFDPQNPVRPRFVHAAFVRFIRDAKNMPQMRKAFGLNDKQFRSYIEGLLPKALLIQQLAPTGDMNKPNPEYPWEQNGTVISPLDYTYPLLGWGDYTMNKMLKFIEKCFEII
jgi:hypothetical protein